MRLSFFLCFFLLQGCSLLTLPIQNKGAGEFWNDSKIGMKVTMELMKDQPLGLNRVYSLIHRGRVLLVGIVPSQHVKEYAVSIVKKVTDVKEVIDDIVVGKEGVCDYLSDSIAAKKISTQLLLHPDIYSANYQVTVSDQTAYILGEAQSSKELERVIQCVEDVKGIHTLKHYIIVVPPQKKTP